MTDPTTPTPSETPELEPTTKPGWRTSEFWLHLLAVILSACMASGLIPTTGPAAQIAGMIAAVLASLGYTASRTLVKRAEVKTRAPI